MNFKIEKDFPVPVIAPRAGESKYPFESMEKGDSFFVGAEVASLQTVYGGAYYYSKNRGAGKKFMVRYERGGCRCWRIE